MTRVRLATVLAYRAWWLDARTPDTEARYLEILRLFFTGGVSK